MRTSSRRVVLRNLAVATGAVLAGSIFEARSARPSAEAASVVPNAAITTTIQITPTPRYCAVNQQSNDESVIDGATNLVTSTLHLAGAEGVATNSKTGISYVCGRDAISVITG